MTVKKSKESESAQAEERSNPSKPAKSAAPQKRIHTAEGWKRANQKLRGVQPLKKEKEED